MKTNVSHGETTPSVYVTRNKQRLKQYNNIVYLDNNDEFELELFNPTSNKILAQIELNGDSIGSGIVLRPGERIFLERYFNIPIKFSFQTYFVNDNIEKEIIKNNGLVCVKFYDEITPYNYWWSPNIIHHWDCTPIQYDNNFIWYTNNTPNIDYSLTNAASNSVSNSINVEYNSNIAHESKAIETGRVEYGEHSNQNFGLDYSNFNSFYSWIKEWKILPKSQKPMTKEDLITRCDNCDAKRKKNYRYCPNCGYKFK